MRTVRGRTDHVVVVGAGLGGLSAALRLTGAGRRVTVLERESVPGGRAGVLTDSGYTFDTGPSVLTMPGLIADALACVGESMTDWLDLVPVRPLYRARFADGSSLDVHTDPDAMAEEIAAVCGPADAAGYRRYVAFVSRLYELEMRGFIDRNIDSPFGLLTPGPRPAGCARRVPAAGAEGGPVLLRRPDPAGVLLPVDVRRPLAVRRPRDLCGDRLHGLGRRRLLPEGRHARHPAGAGCCCTEARRGASATTRRSTGSSCAGAGPSPCTRRRASGCRATPSC